MVNDEKRNSTKRITAPNNDTGEHKGRVGGRHKEQALLPKGGGYLDICKKNRAGVEAPPEDPRLSELHRIGLPYIWLQCANAIGYDAFVRMWHLLQTHFDGARLRVPRYERYLLLRRNEYIRELANQDIPVRKIKVLVQRVLGEEISIRSIERIIRG